MGAGASVLHVFRGVLVSLLCCISLSSESGEAGCDGESGERGRGGKAAGWKMGKCERG